MPLMMSEGRHTTEASVDLRAVDMPEGTYHLKPLPDGHWAVRPPNSNAWLDGFDNRFEASIAIAERTGPFAPTLA